jgi:hypothetical protein
MQSGDLSMGSIEREETMPILNNSDKKPACRNCGKPFGEHKTILEICPDQQGRITFETHYAPKVQAQ